MRPPSAAAAAEEIAAIRISDICNLLKSLRYVHSQRSEEEIFQILEDLEEEFFVLGLDFEKFQGEARWIVRRLGTCRPNGHPRRAGGGRKKGSGK